ncbi:MAG: response regulator [Planctomycetota bacterium]
MTDPITILIADDEAHIVYILEGKLAEAGYRVVTARNGAEALKLALDHQPALAITDLNMPGTDGLEFAIGLRDHPATTDTPVIMLTGRGHTVPDEDRARTNIQHLESKPFSARRLLKLVNEVLGAPNASDDVQAA